MRRDDLPNLDIRISSSGAGRYAVELKVGEREFPTGTMGQEVLATDEAAQADEGARLFRALVADVTLRSAWDQVGALHPRRRVRLRIDDGAPELHALAWETLHDPSPGAAVRTLAADLDTPFSRHVVSPWEPLGPAPAPLRVLTAVAAPAGLEDYDLAPIDRAAEVATITGALERAPAGLVQHAVLAGPCTLPALVAELERGYHVLHLVAHGAVSADRTTAVVFLERPDGGIERVDAGRFARAIDCLHRSLRLVVLMSCNTATRSPTDPRFGFAPALLGAGIPAVLAMQDRMPMPTGAAFTRAFYEELWTSGEIDRAANRARRVVITERLPGTAVPALYATPASLRLWDALSAKGQVQEDRSEETPDAAAPPASGAAADPIREAPQVAPLQSAVASPPSQVASPPSQVAAPPSQVAAPPRASSPASGAPAGGATQTTGAPERAPEAARGEATAPGRGPEVATGEATARRGATERGPEAATGEATARRGATERAPEATTGEATARRGAPEATTGEATARRGATERASEAATREATARRGAPEAATREAPTHRGAPPRRGAGQRREERPEAPSLEWQEFGGGLHDLRIIHGLGGCLEAFARDEDGALIRRYQSDPDGEWGPWDVFAEGVEAYDVASDGRGRVAVFTLEGDGWIRFMDVDADGAWSDWIDVFEAPGAQFVAAYRKRGLVLVVSIEDTLHVLEQQRKGGWDEAYSIDGGCEVLAIAGNGADHLHLFALDCDGTLSTTVQRAPRDAWDDWTVLGGGFRGMHPFLGEDDRLHLVALGVEEGVSWTLETEPGGGWEAWGVNPLSYVHAFALSRVGRGIEAYAIDGAGDGWREIWSEAGEGTRVPLGLHGLAALQAVETESGRVELVAVDEHGAALRCVLP